jgi:hypothetical protein
MDPDIVLLFQHAFQVPRCPGATPRDRSNLRADHAPATCRVFVGKFIYHAGYTVRPRPPRVLTAGRRQHDYAIDYRRRQQRRPWTAPDEQRWPGTPRGDARAAEPVPLAVQRTGLQWLQGGLNTSKEVTGKVFSHRCVPGMRHRSGGR